MVKKTLKTGVSLFSYTLVVMFVGLSFVATAADKEAHKSEVASSFIHTLNETYPNKVIYLDFWASWCAPCRLSFPFMNGLQKEYANDLVVIGVNEDDDTSLAHAFLEKYPAEFVIKYDPTGSIATGFNMQAMPSSFVISPSGKVLVTHYGFRKGDDAKLEATIQKMIAQYSTQSLDKNMATK